MDGNNKLHDDKDRGISFRNPLYFNSLMALTQPSMHCERLLHSLQNRLLGNFEKGVEKSWSHSGSLQILLFQGVCSKVQMDQEF